MNRISVLLKKETDTLVIPELSFELPSRSHNQTYQQPIRSQRVSARTLVEANSPTYLIVGSFLLVNDFLLLFVIYSLPSVDGNS